MPGPFSLTWRSIEAEGSPRVRAALLATFVVVGALGAFWFVTAALPLYAVTDQARLEVLTSAHRIEAPELGGELVALSLEPGRRVEAGEVLAEIDTDLLQKQLASQLALHQALTQELESVLGQIASLRRAQGEGEQAAQAEIREAQAFYREARAEADNAGDEAARMERLHTEGQVSVKDLERARAEAEARESAAQGLEERVQRLRREHQATDNQRRAELDDLGGRVARLQGDVAVAATTAEGHQHAIGRGQIRAPYAGQIAEVGTVEVGTYLDAGEWIGTLVPDGEFKVVAHFAPDEALGRVRAGQTARLRLDAYPWTLYGAVDARVSRVASEVRAGQVRVDLEIDAAPEQVDLQHGLPGRLEILTETLTPAQLLLRSVGRLQPRPGSTLSSLPEPASQGS